MLLLISRGLQLAGGIVGTYLKRSVKAWKKVWKLLWWFIALSSISSMFPNTWGSRRAGGSRWTIISMDSVYCAILRWKRVYIHILRSFEHMNVLHWKIEQWGIHFISYCFHRSCRLNSCAGTMLQSPAQCFCTTGEWREDNCHNCWCPTVSPHQRYLFFNLFAPHCVHPARLTDHWDTGIPVTARMFCFARLGGGYIK